MNAPRILGTLIVGAYALVMFSGWDIASHPRNDIPPSVRASPGGYRAWSFWHAGEHGGK